MGAVARVISCRAEARIGTSDDVRIEMQPTLEERVSQLEQRLDALTRGNAAPNSKPKDWRRTVGMFRDDPIMKEIIDHAQQAREAERAAASTQAGSDQP